MILAAVVLKLEAQNTGRLPASHGRLLHAAFLNALRAKDEALSALLHNAASKSFSLGMLKLSCPMQKMTYQIAKGTQAQWRICVMGEHSKAVLNFLQDDFVMRVGSINFLVKDVYVTPQQHSLAGLTTTEYLEAQCEELPPIEHLTLDFITPTTFRFFEQDYPWPKAELVFGSLAERWNQVSGEEHFAVDKVKEIAAGYLIPEKWQGNSRRVNLSPQHGVTGFVGSFTFKLALLPSEYRTLFICLAEFAVFAGVGRLTGQGMGQVIIKYE